jgi:hypothetical protein
MFNVLRLTSLLGLLININTASASGQLGVVTLEKQGFIFKFQGCKNRSNADIPLECEFKVENIQEGRRIFNLDANQSRIIDSEGNEIRGLVSNLGNRDTTNQNNNYPQYYYPQYYQQGIVLVNKIPVTVSVSFAKAPAGEIRLIDLLCYSQDTNYRNSSFNVEFIF